MDDESANELEDLALAPRGEMAVVADTDAWDDEVMPDTVPDPRSMPFVPHVRVSTRLSTRPVPPSSRSSRDRFAEEELPPPSV